jgi:hypothetical protein
MEVAREQIEKPRFQKRALSLLEERWMVSLLSGLLV